MYGYLWEGKALSEKSQLFPVIFLNSNMKRQVTLLKKLGVDLSSSSLA